MNDLGFEVEEGAVDAPERIAVIGDGGIGKTTFASNSPRPIFLDLEGGSKRLKYVARNKNPISNWPAIMETLVKLETEKHPFKTVVIDTLDRAEWYCWQYLCERDGATSIEFVAKGYGKGYTEAYTQFRGLFAALERLVEKREMHVILLAHPKIEKVRNPGGSDYDRTVMKLHTQVSNMLYEACDHVLFATRNMIVTEDFADEKRPRAIGGEKRILHSAGNPNRMAKTRASVPDPLPLSWHEWVSHVAAAGFPRLLRETVVDNARRLGDPTIINQVNEIVRGHANDVGMLSKANEKLLKRLGTAFQPEEPASAPSAQPADASAQAQQPAQPSPTGQPADPSVPVAGVSATAPVVTTN